MNIENEAIQTIANEIKKATNEALKSAHFDRTVKGRILTYSGNNKYQVQLNDGEKYLATSFNAFNIGEVVYVTIAENNYSNLFITSSVTSTNQSSTWTLEDQPLSIS